MNGMNQEALLCRLIANSSGQKPIQSQRQIAQSLDISLGKANQLVNRLIEQGYLERAHGYYVLTDTGKAYLDQFKVDNAIFLAAGFGSRFVPFSYETHKGLFKVKGVPMIERQIEQLKTCGIDEIIIVVGYLKEAFDYLVDKYGVKLVFNPEYAVKNNFVSLYYVLDHLKNSYVLVADNWIEESIFNTWEIDSWFCCPYFEGETAEWAATTDSQGRIIKIQIGGENTLAVVGPAFFTKEFSKVFSELTIKHYQTLGTDDDYWEQIIKDNLSVLPPMYANEQSLSNFHEFETFEELREYDDSYQQDTNNATMHEIALAFDIPENAICGIAPLKAGITNYSFVFYVNGYGYVFRTPGEGTERLINRRQEKAAYDAVTSLNITDEIITFDPERGTKISKYYAGVHVVDVDNADELAEAARLIKVLHTSGAFTDYPFDIEGKISFYRFLADEKNAILFSDFEEIAAKMQVLLDLKNRLNILPVLCHGEFVNTNVLIFPDGSGKIIDWEYSGMGDPIMDISMFAISSAMERDKIERLLRLYVGGDPSFDELRRLYLYVALGGFLWSIWAEYKQACGQEFGEYPLRMYRYAKDYYNILKEEGYLDY